MDILDTLTIAAPPAAVSANRFGKLNGDGTTGQCVAGDAADGVIQYGTDGAISLMYDGILPVAAAGVLAVGTLVASDANGRAVAASGANALGRMVNNTSAAALDDIVEIQFFRKGQGSAGVGPTGIAASGALGAAASSTSVITNAGATALTLAAPASDGLTLIVTSNTAFAHTITATGLLRTGTAFVNVLTFAAQTGASATLYSTAGKWNLISSNGITAS